MTWSLNASGHTPTPEGADNWAEVEQELHDELQKVLSNPKYGATSSRFGGNHVVSEGVHLPTLVDAEPEHEAHPAEAHEHHHHDE